MDENLLINDRYQITRRIGAGGMGDVYLGEDNQSGTQVAIKRLKADILERDPTLIERFRREGDALRALNHPNIVKVLDTVAHEGDQYIIMEYVPGGSLSNLLTEMKRLPIKQAVSIALDLSDALIRAHRLDIVHRDIKPDNVLIAKDGTPRLTDFGVAHFGDQTTLTDAGAVVGTYAYLSPEACMGKPLDHRTDIWAFGVMLYEMLAGERPFGGNVPGAIITNILTSPLPDLKERRPDIPDDLNDLLYRMLDKTVEGRIPSVRLVGAVLESQLKGTGTGSLLAVGDHTDSPETILPAPSVLTSTDQGLHNLPAQPTPFVGREAELAELARLIADDSTRMLAILGPGGVGKTRLSLEAGRAALDQFENGVYFIELAPLSQSADIPSTVAEAVGVPVQDGQDLLAQVVNYLAGKHILLIFDNFEHLVDGAPIIRAILEAGPDVQVLVTSRQRLNLSTESIFTIGGMDFPEWETPEDAMRYSAVQLFIQSAQRARVDFELADNDLDYVARICRLVEGMPLGILLAAAWVDTLDIEEIAEEIAQSVDFLETEMVDIPARQRSIRAVFDYSWVLLDENERNTLIRMSVFRGGCSRRAAQEISGASLKMLTRLVNHSLLQRDPTSGRFHVHELLRQIGAERLETVEQAEALHAAHAAYYLNLLVDLYPDIKGRDQKAALESIDSDFENIKAAWRYAVDSGDARLIEQAVDPLTLYLSYRARGQEGVDLFEAARRKWPYTVEPVSVLASKLAIRFIDADLDHFERILDIARGHDDPLEIAYALNQVGRRLTHAFYDFDSGMPFMDESLALYKAHGDDFLIARALDDQSFSMGMSGDNDSRIILAEESLAMRRRIGDQIGTSNSLRNLAIALTNGGRQPEAMPYFEEVIEIARSINDKLNEGWALTQIGSANHSSGNIEKAEADLARALTIAKEINSPEVLSATLILMAAIELSERENYQLAFDYLTEGYDLDSEPNMLSPIAYSVYILTYLGLGQTQQATDVIRNGVDLFINFTGDVGITMAMMVPMLVVLFALEGAHQQAAELLGFRDQNPPGFLNIYDQWALFRRLEEKVKTELGSERFQACFETGQHYTPEHVLEMIRAHTG